MIERMEDEGRIIAIRPEQRVVVNRIEKDIKKLTSLYEEGYACAEKSWGSSCKKLYRLFIVYQY